MSIFQSSTNTPLQHSKPSKDIDYFFPPPESLIPALLSRNVPEKMAERLSAVYIRRTNELRDRLKKIVQDTLSKLSPWGNSNSFAILQNDLYETYRRKYLSSLADCLQEVFNLASRHVASQRPPSIAALGCHTDDKKSKRRFKPEYLPLFEFAFSKDRFPSREDKKHLARVSGMSYRQISVWFQNRRCRSGKHSRATASLNSRKDEPQDFGRTHSILQCGFDKEGCSTVDIQLSSSNIIDLTVNENHHDKASYDEEMELESSSGGDTSSEVIDDTLGTDPRLSFPYPYVPSAPTADPFNIQLDPSLWPKHRGLKRRRTCKRDLGVDDIVFDLRSMDVTSCLSLSTRPMKSLPKRTQANVFLPPMSHPSPSTTCLSESSDEPPLSPTSHTSYSTVASSPDSNEICLSPPFPSDSLTIEYGEDKAVVQCLPGRSIPDTCLYQPEFVDSQENKNRVDAFSHYAETSAIGLDLGIWSS